MLSDAVMLSCMCNTGLPVTGDDRLNLFGQKVNSISLAAAQSDAQLDVCHNPSYSHIKDGRQKSYW
jgi:hypothetical protein